MLAPQRWLLQGDRLPEPVVDLDYVSHCRGFSSPQSLSDRSDHFYARRVIVSVRAKAHGAWHLWYQAMDFWTK
ncbi:Hypothetical protein SMAX5B_013475 [Scophthalmus maximus]|uniref:Uncharacterized protein n=1 Tax=Scophthalmus maximus TaxID=52904 RepID=A0A2U9B5K3_SCOMX|nr:Hypothetical protein SMAX5B_013475 [Scophthalmus maximus]